MAVDRHRTVTANEPFAEPAHFILNLFLKHYVFSHLASSLSGGNTNRTYSSPSKAEGGEERLRVDPFSAFAASQPNQRLQNLGG